MENAGFPLGLRVDQVGFWISSFECSGLQALTCVVRDGLESRRDELFMTDRGSFAVEAI